MIFRKKILSPLIVLAENGKLTGLLLIIATVFSLAVSNSAWGSQYLAIWKITLGPSFFRESLLYWINDGLMAIFFFLVGLEIKRELLVGELSTRKQALLPVMAALGGMLFPALIFVGLNFGKETISGWAIPTATDIAFSLGVLSLLGSRVPFRLKIFLTALAIIDDLGAVLVIAFFYTEELHFNFLLLSAACLVLLLGLARMKLRWFIFYLPLGLLLWFFVFESGVHATIAGVVFAFTIPLQLIERLEHGLHRPVNFFIMPVFALANTAIALPAFSLSGFFTPLSLGIILGLVAGKSAGITAACRLAEKLKWAQLPPGVTWKQILGVAFTAGIGFTMSIFIASLSFSTVTELNWAKLSVLAGSTISALCGLMILSAKQSGRIQ